MLELLREIHRMHQQFLNTVNEMWAEWTRLHTPTIDRSGPPKKVAQEQQESIARRKVVRR